MGHAFYHGSPSKEASWLLVSLIQASQDKKSLDVGANLFVGNLDPVSESHARFAYDIGQLKSLSMTS